MRKRIYAMMIAMLGMIFNLSAVSSNPIPSGGITEISVDPDFIEIHFQHWSRGMFQKPFTVDGKVVTVDPNYDPFLAGEYVVYDSTNTSGFDLKPEGGFIKIPGVGDTLRYGPGQACPSPPAGESVTTNGEYPFNLYPYIWNFDPTPTPRARNDAPNPRYGSGTVFINEVSPGDGSTSAYIELYNNSDSGVNIGGFSLINCARYTIPAETMIPAHGFFVLNEKDFPKGFIISSLGGTIYLQNSSFELVDQMGWPGGLEAAISLNRIPDGFATVFQGYTYDNSIDFREGHASPGQPNTGFPIFSMYMEKNNDLICPGALKPYYCKGTDERSRTARILPEWSISGGFATADQFGKITGIRCGDGVLTAQYDSFIDTLYIRGAVGGLLANDAVWKKENNPYRGEGEFFSVEVQF